MPTVEKTHGGAVSIRGIGDFSVGDQADVDDETAAYLTEGRGDFAHVLDEEGGDETPADAPDYTEIPPNLEDCTYEELMEIARDQDLEGRSSMDKAELIDALQED